VFLPTKVICPYVRTPCATWGLLGLNTFALALTCGGSFEGLGRVAHWMLFREAHLARVDEGESQTLFASSASDARAIRDRLRDAKARIDTRITFGPAPSGLQRPQGESGRRGREG